MTTSAQTTRFAEAHPAEWEWLNANCARNEFAASLSNQVYRKGYLSERQLAAIQGSLQRRAAAVEREANAPAASLARIEEGFACAKSKGLQRPKLTIAGLRFSPAPDTGVNAGAIYAKEKESGTYLGKFAHGRFVASASCTQEKQALLLSIAVDPFAAAVNHGKLTGACAICSRPLSDPASVERAIGPICAEKFGWL